MRALFALALGLAGCAARTPFACWSDASCVAGALGVCQPTGYCSFADAVCGSGQRYGALAPIDLAGLCVGADPDGGTSGPYNLVFVTSSTYVPGKDFVGLSGADAECQRVAESAKRTGTYVAWIGTSEIAASQRIVGAGGRPARGFVRTDGRPFGDSIDSIVGKGEIFFPLSVDELGHRLAEAHPLVASNTDSTAAWASPAAYVVGDGTATAGCWTDSATAAADMAAHLYCFGVDHATPLAVSPQAGRRAFVTVSAFKPQGGVAAADAACQKEAMSAGLERPTVFRALLSTSASSAAARFDLLGPAWVRLDGVPLVEKAQDLAAGPLLAPLNVDVTGGYVGKSFAWSGADTPGQGAAQSCGDWASSSGVGQVGQACRGGSQWFAYSTGVSCATAELVRLYCLEGP